jgi:WD40 repeat protein
MKRWLTVLLLLALLQLGALAHPTSVTVTGAGWTSDGAYLVTTGPSRSLRVHHGSTGTVVKEVTAPGEVSTYIAFSPDSGYDQPNELGYLAVSGTYAVTASADYTLHWWKIPELEIAQQSSTTYNLVGLSLAAEGTVAAYTDTSTRYLDSCMTLVRWSAPEGLTSESFSDLSAPDSSSSFGVPRLSPNGQWAAARVADTVKLWNLLTPGLPAVDLGQMPLAMGNSFYYSADAKGVSQNSYAAEQMRHLICPEATDLAVDQAENLLLALAGDGLWIWELSTSNPPRQWTKSAEKMTICPDGKKVGLWQKDHLEVWDLETEKLLFKLDRPREEPSGKAFRRLPPAPPGE